MTIKFTQTQLADIHTAAFRRAVAASPARVVGGTWYLESTEAGCFLVTPVHYERDGDWVRGEMRTPLFEVQA